MKMIKIYLIKIQIITMIIKQPYKDYNFYLFNYILLKIKNV